MQLLKQLDSIEIKRYKNPRLMIVKFFKEILKLFPLKLYFEIHLKISELPNTQ